MKTTDRTSTTRRLAGTIALSLALALGHTAPAWANRASGATKTVAQPDSTTLCITLHGDETFHFWATADGIPVVCHNGTYVYAQLLNDSLAPTAWTAHEPARRTPAEQEAVERLRTREQAAQTWTRLAAQRNGQRRRLAATAQTGARTSAAAPWTENQPTTGQRRGLVILMQFPDRKMAEGHTRETFEHMFNQAGYNADGHVGSVHDYFADQSYGQLDLQFDVVGPFTAQHPMAYYGDNNDKKAYELIVEACKAADATVDFRNYDWNHSPEEAEAVNQVFVIYAGYNEAYGAPASTIWAHEWDISTASRGDVLLNLDGVTIDTYACSSELKGTGGETLDGIGSACHEFAHCLGLPDMYDTQGDTYRMGSWDLMDKGNYNGTSWLASNVPAGFTSLERWYCGWLTPATLDSPAYIGGMKPLVTSPEAYVIYNDYYPKEFYLLENRQPVKWDTYTGGHGMLVLHVDYSDYDWYFNRVNAGMNEGCAFIPANYDYVGEDPAGVPYPGTSGATSLTDDTEPWAELYHYEDEDNDCMGKPLTDIAESNDGLISLSFMGGTADAIRAPWDIRKDTPAPDDTALVYTTGGTLLKRTVYGRWQEGLTRGLYVVKTAGHTETAAVGGDLK